MIIRVKNNQTINAPYSYLSTGIAAGGTTLPVQNINAYAPNIPVQIGATGVEQAEIKMLGTAAVSGTALNTTGTITYTHPTDTPVYALKYDQMVFLRSTSGTAGTAAIISGGTVSIASDSQTTNYDDVAWTTGYAYQVYYRNSITSEISALSDWIDADGFSFYSKAKIRDRIKGKLFDYGYITTDPIIDDWINEHLESMVNAQHATHQAYALGTTDVAYSGTAELGTITASDFKHVRRVWQTIDGESWCKSTKLDFDDYDPNQLFSQAHPYHFMQGDNVIGRKPNDISGTARIVYDKLLTTASSLLVNDTDELPVSMRSFTKGFVDYGLGQAYRKDNKFAEAEKEEAKASAEVDKFRSASDPQDRSEPGYVRLVEAIDGDDGMV